MNLDAARRVADAVLYEGYILYPYRASAQKNRSRWQFGVLMAPCYAERDPSESTFAQTECVFEHTGQPVVQVVVRFLQVQRRKAGGEAVWDEAVEREVVVRVATRALLGGGQVQGFVIPAGEDREPPGTGGGAAGDGVAPGDIVVRRRERLAGTVTVSAAPVPGPWQAARLLVRVENRTVPGAAPRTRTQALTSALVAAHTIVGISGGEFISMTDPPQWAKPEVEACTNVGTWPVLAGHDDGGQVVLSAPIILYDHPELAPESPGDLYDGTEIDEILTLRTLALSDAEKREARATDPRAAALLGRVEALDAQAIARLHGAVRHRSACAPVPGDAAGVPEPAAERGAGPPWWDPEADAAVSPGTDAVTIGGTRIARGSRVRLRPGARRSDAQDMFLAGRVAVVQAVLFDVAGIPQLAVSLADDPDEDIRAAYGRYLFFAPDEVEPCQAAP